MEAILLALAALKNAATDFVARSGDFEAAIGVEKKTSFDEGFLEGVKSVAVDEKIFSQKDFDEKIAPLNEQIAALKVELDGVPAKIEAGKMEALEAFKAELSAKFEASQKAEGELESLFAKELAPKV